MESINASLGYRNL